MNGKKKFYLLLGIFQIVLVFIVFFSVDGLITFVSAQAPTNFDYYDTITAASLAIAASISVAAAVLGAAIALKTVGTAAISSLTEREETFFKAFLVVALCEALAIYGFIIAIILWTKIPGYT
ncbi:MAG: ATP synthase subunit C [Promethearchaeota archaeon]